MAQSDRRIVLVSSPPFLIGVTLNGIGTTGFKVTNNMCGFVFPPFFFSSSKKNNQAIIHSFSSSCPNCLYDMNSFSSPPTSPPISTLTSHFVQALHDYLPSSAPVTDEPVTCLFFKKGSIIEVFNRDDSGWWDGQCGEIRGWFPSNYVGRIGEAKRSSMDFERENDDELTQWQQEKHQEKVRRVLN